MEASHRETCGDTQAETLRLSEAVLQPQITSLDLGSGFTLVLDLTIEGHQPVTCGDCIVWDNHLSDLNHFR